MSAAYASPGWHFATEHVPHVVGSFVMSFHASSSGYEPARVASALAEMMRGAIRDYRAPAFAGDGSTSMTALGEFLTPFAIVYELASLTRARLRHRFNHSSQRCPS